MLLSNLAGRLLGTPLLLSRPKLDTLLTYLGERIGVPPLAVPALASPALAMPSLAIPGYAPPPKNLEITRLGAMAVVPVFGTLVRRTLGLDAVSGLTSYSELATQMRSAAAEPAVRGVLLELDSAGGEAGGLFEFAQVVRLIAQEKPVWAVAADSALSAAYAVACAATRVIVTPTAGVGSIGVIAMHVDQSVRDAQQGYRFTAVTAGAHKADLSPHAPPQSDALMRLQREVDRLYGLFVEHVVAMRGLSAKALRATEADVFFAEAALAAGLADAVLGVDETVAEFSQFLAVPQSTFVPVNPTRLSAPPAVTSHFAATENPSQHTTQEVLMSLDSTPEKPTPGADSPLDPPTPPVAIEIPDEELGPPPAQARAAVTGSYPSTPHTYAHAAEIAEMCALANKTERTHGFLIKGLSVAQVRTALLQELASGEEIASVVRPITTAFAASATPAAGDASSNPLLAAIAKLGKN
jgi:capsid assembly protease